MSASTMSNITTPEGVEILAPVSAEYAEILTTEALEFIARLDRAFSSRRDDILQRRIDRQAEIDALFASALRWEPAHCTDAGRWSPGHGDVSAVEPGEDVERRRGRVGGQGHVELDDELGELEHLPAEEHRPDDAQRHAPPAPRHR